tara:strand:+ start:631 stop:969 length:339 start_codon:yes stop_codon:yes gene_type:complete
MKNRKIHLYVYIVSILLLSSIPGESVPSVVGLTWDKSLHFIEYGILGVLLRRAGGDTVFGTIYLCLFGIVIGCLDEFWQTFIPGRTGSYFDVMADAIGVIFGVCTTNYFLNK